MTQSKYDAKIALFAKWPSSLQFEVREAGIPSRMLSNFCKKGIIERISREVYMMEEP